MKDISFVCPMCGTIHSGGRPDTCVCIPEIKNKIETLEIMKCKLNDDLSNLALEMQAYQDDRGCVINDQDYEAMSGIADAIGKEIDILNLNINELTGDLNFYKKSD